MIDSGETLDNKIISSTSNLKFEVIIRTIKILDIG
jgi:hypothetical protein